MTFTVQDETALSDSEQITVTVGNVNRPPVLNPVGNRTVDQGTALLINLGGWDPDGDDLVYTAAGVPVGATFTDNAACAAASRATGTRYGEALT